VENMKPILKVLAIAAFIFLIGHFLERSAQDIESLEHNIEVLAELFTVFVSFSIFAVTWYAYKRSKDNHAIFFGATFLVIGLVDLFHTLSYPFMPEFITPNSTHKSAILWSFARFVSAPLFLASVFIYRDTLPRWINKPVLLALVIVPNSILTLLLLYYSDYLPVMEYPDGSSSIARILALTISIVVISYSGYLYTKRIQKTGERNLIFIIYGFIIVVFSDIIYFSYDFSGHLLKIAGFYLMYLALYRSSVELPYERLAIAEEKLRQSYDFQSVINSLLNFSLEDKPIEEIFKGTLNRIFSIPWFAVESKGCIYLVEDEPEVLVMKAQIGLNEIIQKNCGRVPFGRCLCGRAALTHEIQFADRLDDRHEIVSDGIHPHGHYCVPILSAGRTLGVINLYLEEGHRREQHDEKFLIAVADTLAGIIKRKQSEGTLRDSEDRHRRLVEFSPYGLTIHSEGKLVFVNSAGAKILGAADPSELIGKSIFQIIHPDYHEIVKERIRMGEEGKTASLIEVKFLRLDGTPVDAEIVSIPFTYMDKPAMYGVFRDITERKQAEKIRLENLRLEAADKAKSEFLANMSHELRTPLNASIGFSELLKQGMAGELSEKQEHFIDNILTSNQFLLTLINDILDISKIEAGKIELVPEKMSLPVTIKETLTLIKEKASKHNVLLKTEFDPELEFIEVDKQRFKQILFNLLNNAVKFSKETGGTVTITAKKEGDMAKVSVSDTGIGIKEENIGRLFQKFEQLESGISQKYGGTGLGLAITKQLVEMHGGKIWAESKYGEGSTFTFILPLEGKKVIK